MVTKLKELISVYFWWGVLWRNNEYCIVYFCCVGFCFFSTTPRDWL